jgi:broad specificity phosphatase PhoE
LSAEGRLRCRPFAESLRPYGLSQLVTSVEPKAAETGSLIGEALGIPVTMADGLHEHVRTHGPWLGRDAFEQSVQRFFDYPDALVFGEETASEAYRRFDATVQRVLTEYSADTLAVVTHGTVLTLFFRAHCNIQPFPFWQRLRMPDYFAVTLPDYTLLDSPVR